jgi:DNA-binding transcriptional LysR family regulator
VDRIEELRVFVTVADLRGFAQAGRRLGISPAQVSKLVARLEDRLHSRLFHRTTRDVSLTDEGRALHAGARALVEEYDQLERSAQQTTKPHGLLKVSAPFSFGLQLGPTLLDFARAYPDVGLDVSFTDRLVNLVDDGFDAAVRISTLADSSLVARKLGNIGAVTVASPDYLRRRGTPRTPADLKDHDIILDTNAPDRHVWHYAQGKKRLDVRVDGRLQFGSPYVCVEAARAGFGIARAPDFAAVEDLRSARVSAVLSEYEPLTPVAMYVVYPHARHLAAKVRAFVDFLANRFAKATPGRREQSKAGHDRLDFRNRTIDKESSRSG